MKRNKKGTPLWKTFLFERRLPWRYNWIKLMAFINPIHYPRILKNLDYKNINKLKKPEAEINNKIVSSLILQWYGPKFLKDTLQICKKLNIKPFLVFGTLLGHYRDNGFIKHDDDIDLGLLKKDFDKINLLKQEMQKQGYILRKEYKNSISFYFNLKFLIFAKKINKKERNLTIDFFCFYNKKNKIAYDSKKNKKLYTFSFPSKIFRKFKKIRFLNKIEVLIPKETEKFLTLSYGDWKIPKKDFDYIKDHPNLVK